MNRMTGFVALGLLGLVLGQMVHASTHPASSRSALQMLSPATSPAATAFFSAQLLSAQDPMVLAQAPARSASGPAPSSGSPAPKASDQPVILIVGDSLSAGYGVAVDATWVALLQRRLASQGYGYRVVNASISGETTGGARSRLPRILALHEPAIVVLELGGNDGLRGLPVQQVQTNFQFMIEHSQAAGAKLVLVGMRVPPNYGAAYADRFHALFAQLAEQYHTPLVDFFLEGVAQDASLMQDDDIHPNAAAQPRLLDNLWPALQDLLVK